MYRIYNNALNIVLKPYNVAALDDLTDDNLTKLCEELRLATVPKKDPVRNIYYGMDKDQTLKKIEQYFAFSTYMGDGYWEARHVEKANSAEISPKLSKMRTGQEVFEIMARHKLGFYMLRPGNSVEVDWTDRYLTEVFLKAPYAQYCEVVDMSTGKPVGQKEEKVEEKIEEKIDKMEKLADKLEQAAKEVEKKVPLKELSRAELVSRATKKGIKSPTFKSSEQLIKLLSD